VKRVRTACVGIGIGKCDLEKKKTKARSDDSDYANFYGDSTKGY
jgi:hypothetical protein